MTDEDVFNKRIKKFLKEQPDSDAAILIRKVVRDASVKESYFSTFDELTYKLGFSFLNTAVLNKSDKIIGYSPEFKFHEDNKISKEPGIKELASSNAPMSQERSMKLLTEELIYLLMRVRNLDELIFSEL